MALAQVKIKTPPFFSFVRFVFLSSLRENGAFMHDGGRKERERGNAKRRVKGVEERKKGELLLLRRTIPT